MIPSVTFRKTRFTKEESLNYTRILVAGEKTSLFIFALMAVTFLGFFIAAIWLFFDGDQSFAMFNMAIGSVPLSLMIAYWPSLREWGSDLRTPSLSIQQLLWLRPVNETAPPRSDRCNGPRHWLFEQWARSGTS